MRKPLYSYILYYIYLLSFITFAVIPYVMFDLDVALTISITSIVSGLVFLYIWRL